MFYHLRWPFYVDLLFVRSRLHDGVRDWQQYCPRGSHAVAVPLRDMRVVHKCAGPATGYRMGHREGTGRALGPPWAAQQRDWGVQPCGHGSWGVCEEVLPGGTRSCGRFTAGHMAVVASSTPVLTQQLLRGTRRPAGRRPAWPWRRSGAGWRPPRVRSRRNPPRPSPPPPGCANPRPGCGYFGRGLGWVGGLEYLGVG